MVWNYIESFAKVQQNNIRLPTVFKGCGPIVVWGDKLRNCRKPLSKTILWVQNDFVLAEMFRHMACARGLYSTGKHIGL